MATMPGNQQSLYDTTLNFISHSQLTSQIAE